MVNIDIMDGAKEAPLSAKPSGKKPVHLVFIMVKKFVVLVVDGDDDKRGTRSICDIMIGVTSRGVGPVIHGTGDLLCSPTLE